MGVHCLTTTCSRRGLEDIDPLVKVSLVIVFRQHEYKTSLELLALLLCGCRPILGEQWLPQVLDHVWVEVSQLMS